MNRRVVGFQGLSRRCAGSCPGCGAAADRLMGLHAGPCEPVALAATTR